MRAVLGSVVVLALACGTTVRAGQPAKLDANKLIGKWEPVPEKVDKKKDKKEEDKTPAGPPLPPTVIEFTKDGKLFVTVGEAGRDYRLDGTYQLAADKLIVSFKLPDKEVKETLTVKKLTDAELVTEDSKNQIETLRRKP